MLQTVVTEDAKGVTLLKNESVSSSLVNGGTIYHMRDSMGEPQRCGLRLVPDWLLAQSASANLMNGLYTERALRAMLA